MRMTTDQLVANHSERVSHREPPLVGLDLCQKHSFEEKIAYFPAQRVVIGAVDRVEHLVRLLEDESSQ
jgi:hypothetical protein